MSLGNPCCRLSAATLVPKPLVEACAFFYAFGSRDQLHSESVPYDLGGTYAAHCQHLTNTMSASLSQRHAPRSLRAELDFDAPLSFSKPASRSTISKTISFAELPEWMKDNEFILTGYRG